MHHTQSLTENYEFRRVYGRGKSAGTVHIVAYVLPNRRAYNRLGITVSAKVGKAVLRNKIRRRLKEIYRLEEPSILAGFDIVIVARVKAGESDYHTLRRDFLRLAKKLGILGTNTSHTKGA